MGPSGSGKSRPRATLSSRKAGGVVALRVTPPNGALVDGRGNITSVVGQLGGRLHSEQGWRGVLDTVERCLRQQLASLLFARAELLGERRPIPSPRTPAMRQTYCLARGNSGLPSP